MKKILLSMMAVLTATSIYAQDPSNWTHNQEITSELQWTNTKFQGDQTGWQKNETANVGWFYDESKSTSGSIEMFNNPIGAETYQILFLPAGYYRFTIQAFYRPGSAWAAGWDTRTDQNGFFFCQTGTLEETEAEDGTTIENFKSDREATSALPLIVEDAYQGETKILTEAMCAERNEADWQRDNGFTRDGLQYWVPNSMWGAALYFEMGNYETELMVVNPTDSYIKIGVRKGPQTISDDWIIFDNLRAYYVSDAGEAVQLILAQEEYAKAEKKANDFADEIQSIYGSLGVLMSDAIMEGDFNSRTIEECNASVKAYEALIKEYEGYFAQAKALTDLIGKCDRLASAYSSDEFVAAIAAAREIEQDGNDDADMKISEPTAYGDALKRLSDDRISFIKNLKSENGYIDVTSLISYPWFCHPEYEPSYDAENGKWIPNEKALNEVASDGVKWADKDDVDGTDVNLAAGINVNASEGTPNTWAQFGGGGDLVLYWNDNLTCIKKWAMPSDGFHTVAQLITDIPNGYYKLKALGQTWENDWTDNCKLHINIKSSTMDSDSPFLPKGGWWGKNTDQWLELETGLIQVTDNKVTISSLDNGFAAFTGFRLYYYGENPDFNILIAPELSAVKATIDGTDEVAGLTFAGDRAAANAIIAKIPAKIADNDEYIAALNTIQEAKTYVANANAAIKTLNETTVPAFEKLMNSYAEGSDENNIIMAAWLKAISIGENDKDTYLDAVAAGNDYTAYVNYLSFLASAKKYMDNAEVKAVVEEEVTYLSENYANAAKLAELTDKLAGPYNKAELAALGADKATLDNPVDITSLVINPKYDEGAKGWTGELTVDSLGTVERWNVNCNISQTIYHLPAGTYMIKVQAFYRDGGDAGTAYNNFWYNALDEETGEWANTNAKLYANENQTDVVSIASESFAARSYTQYVDKWVESAEGDAEGNAVYEPHYAYQFKKEVVDAETGEITYEELDETTCSNDYPWDTKVEDADDIYFYPASLRGTACRFAKNPEAYINEVAVVVEEGGSITFGIRKDTLIPNDWVTMDNWKLYYCGTEVPSVINSANADAAVKGIYSVTGARLNSVKKGINIIKTENGVVKQMVK